jgi:hypothetical protein
VGLVAWRRNWLLRIPYEFGMRWFRSTLIAGSVVWVAAIVTIVATHTEDALAGGFTWQSAVVCFWESFFCLGICLGLIVLFREKGDDVQHAPPIWARHFGPAQSPRRLETPRKCRTRWPFIVPGRAGFALENGFACLSNPDRPCPVVTAFLLAGLALDVQVQLAAGVAGQIAPVRPERPASLSLSGNENRGR